ncbi:MAG: hypothetical protein QW197_02515 [Candidatus Aenigmatarchaeota archaeon]
MVSYFEFAIAITFLLAFFIVFYDFLNFSLKENYYDDKYIILKTLNQLSFFELRDLVYFGNEQSVKSYLERYLKYSFDVKICDSFSNCSFLNSSDYRFVVSYLFSGYEKVNPKILLIYVKE